MQSYFKTISNPLRTFTLFKRFSIKETLYWTEMRKYVCQRIKTRQICLYHSRTRLVRTSFKDLIKGFGLVELGSWSSKYRCLKLQIWCGLPDIMWGLFWRGTVYIKMEKMPMIRDRWMYVEPIGCCWFVFYTGWLPFMLWSCRCRRGRCRRGTSCLTSSTPAPSSTPATPG